MSLLARDAFPALGTTAVLVTSVPGALAPAREALATELAAIDAACSRFRADSELVALNGQAGQWVAVSPALFEAVEVALRVWDGTGGAVDPTVGGALRRLGYDRSFELVAPVGGALRVTYGPVPGAAGVEMDGARRRIRISAGTELDLGATAKALAADRAATRAAAVTGAGVLVGLGGDIAVGGPPPPAGWSVRVTDDHRAPAGAPGQDVVIHSGGLATSSVTVRAWERDGQRLHHLVDPATGRPAAGPWRTVSVAAATCVDANAASTAALILGPAGAQWLEERGLPARLVTHDGRVRTVAGWPAEAA